MSVPIVSPEAFAKLATAFCSRRLDFLLFVDASHIAVASFAKASSEIREIRASGTEYSYDQVRVCQRYIENNDLIFDEKQLYTQTRQFQALS